MSFRINSKKKNTGTEDEPPGVEDAPPGAEDAPPRLDKVAELEKKLMSSSHKTYLESKN